MLINEFRPARLTLRSPSECELSTSALDHPTRLKLCKIVDLILINKFY